jgi:hypothetical protein
LPLTSEIWYFGFWFFSLMIPGLESASVFDLDLDFELGRDLEDRTLRDLEKYFSRRVVTEKGVGGAGIMRSQIMDWEYWGGELGWCETEG